MILLLGACLINTELVERRRAELTDADGDGFVLEDECDDGDASIHPGAEEVCDGEDQDCDGEVDEDAVDLSAWYPDYDRDGHGVRDGEVRSCSAPGDGFASVDDDCDDEDAGSYPGATEIAYDGVDQDCSGTDLDDLDGDGFALADDCDDSEPDVHPGSGETWANAFRDDDCDGVLEQDAPLLVGDTLWYSAVENAGLGSRVAPYVDVDGDGVPELLAAAASSARLQPNGGAVYVLSPTESGDVDHGAVRVIDAGGSDWYLGIGLDARDLDGDGLPEVLTTAVGKDTTGVGYMVSGATLQAGNVVLPNGAAHTFNGAEANTYWGSNVAFLGDIDGDGVDEVAMSASYATVGEISTAGRVAVFSLDEKEHLTSDADYAWYGYYEGARFGETLASVGDVDGDGLPDTLVSAEAGDIFVVLPAVTGSVQDLALSRVTRDADTSRFRSVPVGDLDGAGGADVVLLGEDRALVMTGLGAFTLRTQSDAWMTVTSEDGSMFGDAIDLGDRTEDGLPETLLTRTWSPTDETSWAGVLMGNEVVWRSEVSAAALEISVLSTRPNAGLGYRVASIGSDPGFIAISGIADDRGATGGGSVAIFSAPE